MALITCSHSPMGTSPSRYPLGSHRTTGPGTFGQNTCPALSGGPKMMRANPDVPPGLLRVALFNKRLQKYFAGEVEVGCMI